MSTSNRQNSENEQENSAIANTSFDKTCKKKPWVNPIVDVSEVSELTQTTSIGSGPDSLVYS